MQCAYEQATQGRTRCFKTDLWDGSPYCNKHWATKHCQQLLGLGDRAVQVPKKSFTAAPQAQPITTTTTTVSKNALAKMKNDPEDYQYLSTMPDNQPVPKKAPNEVVKYSGRPCQDTQGR